MTGRAALVLLLVCACGGDSAPPPRSPEPASPQPDDDPIEGMTVYDAAGHEQRCKRPERDCPPLAPNPDFEEQCRVAGFRVQLCGCEAMCTGQATKQFYDAEGKTKSCAPEGDCTPPAASAAFQDACTERGFQLKVCGCEWLCSGDPKR